MKLGNRKKWHAKFNKNLYFFRLFYLFDTFLMLYSLCVIYGWKAMDVLIHIINC